MIRETFYQFKLDKQSRILLPKTLREVYEFDKITYMKLLVLEAQLYLKLMGKEFDFYQMTATIDEKGRLFIPREVRDKLDFAPGIILDSFEQEVDMTTRHILLKKR